MNVLTFILDALTSAYNREPESNIGRLMSIFAEGTTGAEAALKTVHDWRDIHNAQGITLDRIGGNYGVAREGADDTYYRLMIKTKVVSLLSGGDCDTIISAAAVLFDIMPQDISLQEVFPAKVWVIVDEALLGEAKVASAGIVAKMIKRIAAAGVDTRLILRARFPHRRPLVYSTACFEHTVIRIAPAGSKRTYTRREYVNSAAQESVTITARPTR